MRRKPGTLLPIEFNILAAGLELRASGTAEFHGYRAAHVIREQEAARMLTSHGTLYKALERLRTQGMLTSRWEDPAIAAEAGRPRRRLYTVTAAGIAAVEAARSASAAQSATRDPSGLQPA
ncbi:MAG: helix-turn-helix transcriptional regulator [Chloroflexi bacterium]|nr:helix-turn-helix transcriptional regulator [Chloroflexota bacterium]MDA1147585.1 helix-turn-helix transcriptional regulator [Chloroflexota bacterium]